MCRAAGPDLPSDGAIQRFHLLRGQAFASSTYERFAGGPARERRPDAAPGPGGPGPVAGLSGGAARRDTGRNKPRLGRRRRPGPEPHEYVAGGRAPGVGAQKKSIHAAERDTERVVALRRLFLEAIQPEDVTRFVFVDETSINLTYCRRYGRAPAGQRLDQAVPLHSGPNVTLLAALTPDGLGALLSVNGAVNGAVNGDVFAAYLDQVLGPTLRPGDVVVLDNLSVHKVDGLDDIVRKYGARLRYLPPYSPDFNPIELAFSKLKTWLRTAKARTRDLLEEAIRAAAEWVTEQDAKNWFDHCGYHVQ
ncbi:IS630 family transposase [Hymenobacter nivis]|uniref:IS630 family transposase n=1 Tax=Hymenobacter nivis TaxID=1850093 RepID=A0A2Z3GU32_9BACT|nr:IS630 family transposase [Hymenobacter nivis]